MVVFRCLLLGVLSMTFVADAKEPEKKKASQEKNKANKKKTTAVKAISMEQLQTAYKANLRDLQDRLKNRSARYKGAITSVGRLTGEGNYRVGLDGGQGKFNLTKGVLADNVHKRIVARIGKDSGKLSISFSGVWFSNDGNIFYFKDLRDVELDYKAPPKKKPAPKKNNNKKKKKN